MHAGWFDLLPFFRQNRGVSWQNWINASQAHWAALLPTLSDIYLKYKTSNPRLTPLHYPEQPENSDYIYTYVVDIFGMVFFLSKYTHGVLLFQRWPIIWIHTPRPRRNLANISTLRPSSCGLHPTDSHQSDCSNFDTLTRTPSLSNARFIKLQYPVICTIASWFPPCECANSIYDAFVGLIVPFFRLYINHTFVRKSLSLLILTILSLRGWILL